MEVTGRLVNEHRDIEHMIDLLGGYGALPDGRGRLN
jgi:hypothetical protein